MDKRKRAAISVLPACALLLACLCGSAAAPAAPAAPETIGQLFPGQELPVELGGEAAGEYLREIIATQEERLRAREEHLASFTEEELAESARLEAEHEAAVEAAKEYAYMDLETAPEELRDKILEARNTVIFSQSWVADGYGGMSVIRADGTIEHLPLFSELFPEDWDIPGAPPGTLPDGEGVSVLEAEDGAGRRPAPAEGIQYGGGAAHRPAAILFSVDRTLYLEHPSSQTDTDTFFNYFLDDAVIYTEVSELTASRSCNVGYTDLGTGASIGFQENMTPGDIYIFWNAEHRSFNCGVRASTYDTPGYGTLTVTVEPWNTGEVRAVPLQ